MSNDNNPSDMVALERHNKGASPEEIYQSLKVRANQSQWCTRVLERVLCVLRPPADQEQSPAKTDDFAQLLREMEIQVRGGTENMVVLAVGISGAGKSTTIRRILRELPNFSQNDAAIQDLFAAINDITKLFGMFTNAPTSSNKDSTRCISRTRLRFNSSTNTLVGIEFICEALEISRAMPHDQQDSFHVLRLMRYYLRNGQPDLVLLESDINASVMGSKINHQSSRDITSSTEDKHQILWLWSCLQTICPDDIIRIAKTLLAILLIRDVPTEHDLISPSMLELSLHPIADLLDFPLGRLRDMLGCRFIAGEQIPVTTEQFNQNRIGLGAAIYSKLFNDVTKVCNDQLANWFRASTTLGPKISSHVYSVVTLVDIPGAEDFKENHLAQCTVNYVNEFIQHQVECILHAETADNDPALSTVIVPKTMSVASLVLEVINNKTKMGNHSDEKQADLVLKLGAQPLVEVTDDHLRVSWTHFSGHKSYLTSRLMTDNAIRAPAGFEAILEKTAIPIISTSLPAAGRQVTTTSIEIARKAVMRLVDEIEQADRQVILCCIRNVHDPKEMAHIALHKVLELGLVDRPCCMSVQIFLETYGSLFEESPSSDEDAISNFLGDMAESFPRSLSKRDFQVTNTSVYLTINMRNSLDQSITQRQQDMNEVGEQSMMMGDFDFDVEDDVELDRLDKAKQLLESGKRSLEHEKRSLQAGNDTLRSSLASCQQLLAVTQSDLAKEKSELVAASRHLAATQKELADEKSESMAAKQKFNEKVEDHEKHIANLNKELRDSNDANDELAGRLSETHYVLDHKLAEIERLQEGVQNLDTELSRTKDNLRNEEAKHQAQIAAGSRLQLELKHAESQIAQRKQAQLQAFTQYLARFHLYGNNNASLSQLVEMQANYLSEQVAACIDTTEDFGALHDGVKKCALSEHPANTLFPLMQVLECYATRASTTRNHAKQCERVLDMAIKRFQTRFMPKFAKSTALKASDVTNKTIIRTLRELLSGAKGLSAARQEQLLCDPLSQWLQQLFEADLISEGQVVYERLQRDILAQEIAELVQHDYPEVSSWMLAFFGSTAA